MAESLICTTGGGENSSITQRRIEFHLARKPLSGFTSSSGSSDFHLETLNPNVDCSQRPGPSMSKSVSSAEKKSDGGDLSELGLDAELFYGITFRRIGAGLENLGNTCFLNSVLQCLTYTQPFAAYLQSGKHKSSCHIAGFCAMCAIQNHVSRALQSTGRILAPKDLVMNLRCISRNFRNARQEDAHEYMVNLLESMHKCSLPSGVPSQSPSAYEKSLVHKIFGGRLRSQVKCTQCSYCSNTFDPFLDLSLEILKADSLRKALSHFTATEQLDGGERQYHCERCKQKVRALKQLTVHKAPYVLTIHLKRFGSHVPGQKINKKVEFGPTLDLKPFVSGSYEGDLKYTLYGVLVHAGWSTHSGHYYCFVRTSTGMWHSLDDNRVVQVSEKTVLEQNAYMLFYVRDIKNLGPKKPINAVPKENMMPSAIGNRTSFIPTASLKENVQNGSSMKALSTSACSSAAAVTQSVGSSSLKGNQLKEASLKEIKIPNMTKNLALLKNPLGHSLKERAKGPSTDGLFVKEGLRQSVSFPDKCNANTSHPIITNAGANNNQGSSYERSNEVSCVPSVPAPLDSVESQNSGSKKLVAVKVTEEVGGIVDERMSNALSNQSGSAKIQNKIVSNRKRSSDKSHQKAKENGISSQLSTITGSVQKKGKHHQPKKGLKPKKKLMKFHSPSLLLSSKLMLKASLGPCKKKKHKRNKKHSSELRESTKEDLDCDLVSKRQEQLTPKKTKNLYLHSAHSSEQPEKSAQRDGCGNEEVNTANDNSKISTIKGDFKERICLNAAVLATNELPKKSSSFTSEATRHDSSEPDFSQQKIKDKSQNGFMSVLTRGLAETTVARWDGTESRSSHVLGLSTSGSISIGYVPDEWDEEYDKGKRKKVREHKNEFGGMNPFQEIASMKAQVNKKAKKMEKKSSANQPFRI